MHSVNANVNQTLQNLADQQQSESERILEELRAQIEAEQQEQAATQPPAVTVPADVAERSDHDVDRSHDVAHHATAPASASEQTADGETPDVASRREDQAAGLAGVALWTKLTREGQPRLTPVDPPQPPRKRDSDADGDSDANGDGDNDHPAQ